MKSRKKATARRRCKSTDPAKAISRQVAKRLRRELAAMGWDQSLSFKIAADPAAPRPVAPKKARTSGRPAIGETAGVIETEVERLSKSHVTKYAASQQFWPELTPRERFERYKSVCRYHALTIRSRLQAIETKGNVGGRK